VHSGGGENLSHAGGADSLASDQAARLAQDVISRPFPFCCHGSSTVKIDRSVNYM
jgi:hypothetical protein